MENRNVWIGVGVAVVAAILLFIWSPWSDVDDATTTTAAVDTTTTTAEEATTSTAGEETTTTSGATTTTEAEAALPDLGGRTVTVAVENFYLPYNFILPGETEGQGWDYDAWRDICERLNCVPEFIEASWPALIDQVAQGEFDTAADGISITDDRREIVDYSIPYMVVQQKFIKQLGDDRFNSADDVINSDAIVATQVGTTNFELAAELVGEDRIQAFELFPLAIQALIAGDVDVVIIDDAAGLGYIGENADQLETVDDSLQSDPLGFIYPQGSDLVEPVDLTIQAMIDDGTMEELGLEWFGPEFTVTYEDLEG